TGVGIRPEVMDRLFEAFVQAETGYTRTRQGSGLGLAISRRLARLMGGDLPGESRPGEGSAFTLWLPAAAHAGHRPSVDAGPGDAPQVQAPARGSAAVGSLLLEGAGEVAGRYVRRLRELRPVPHVDELPDPVLRDHAVALVADLAETLILLEVSPRHAAEMLRDGYAIQRTISDRHGTQRQRIGWTEEAMEEEFRILREEVERAAREAAGRSPGADPEAVVELLTTFLRQAGFVSTTVFRMAARGATTT
ncbi:MAG TPA: ATP-binding protein, partial [Longimicrobiaceae bacterium]|nr:ATP-binding protein [Longimicrobiaceae bacterium]